MAKETLRILFVVNPKSGTEYRGKVEAIIRNYFTLSEHSYEWYQLGSDSDATSMAYWIESWKPDRIVAVGGDGTVRSAAKLLLHSGIPLGILPSGSANGMAKELGLPKNLRACLDIIVEGKPTQADVIFINDSEICLHLADMGLNAQLVKYHDERSVRGMWGYIRGIFKMMWQRKELHLSISTESESLQLKAFMVVIANAQQYGTGAKINPEGKITDGRFELVIMKKIDPFSILKMWWNPNKINPNAIQTIVAHEATIVSQQPAYFQIDGEYLGSVAKVSARVSAGCITLIAPPVLKLNYP